MACEVDDCYWRPRKMHSMGENATTGNRKSYNSRLYMLQAAMLKFWPPMLRPKKLEPTISFATIVGAKKRDIGDPREVVTTSSWVLRRAATVRERTRVLSRLAGAHTRGGWGRDMSLADLNQDACAGQRGKKIMTWGKADRTAPACWIGRQEADRPKFGLARRRVSPLKHIVMKYLIYFEQCLMSKSIVPWQRTGIQLVVLEGQPSESRTTRAASYPDLYAAVPAKPPPSSP